MITCETFLRINLSSIKTIYLLGSCRSIFDGRGDAILLLK